MTRYTSPALSRDLAEAGLEQKNAERMWCMACTNFGSRTHLKTYGSGIRALDLMDVLREIEKRGATWLVETDNGTYCTTVVFSPKFSTVMGGPTAVEAAALCLLALMDKLSEAKP